MSLADLQAAVARETAHWSIADLRAAARRVSDAYEAADRRGVRPRLNDADRAAYVLMRMPATAAALAHVVDALARRVPAFVPASVLDLGAGPGTLGFVVRERYGVGTDVTCVERDPGFRAVAERMGIGLRSHWVEADLAGAPRLDPHDLVTMSYVLGELSQGVMDDVVDAAWTATRTALLLVEPGTPSGSARVLRARARIVAAGGRVVAPCPHDEDCPMRPPEWCHFAVRLSRTRSQRLAKGGALGWEDEKFSYVVLVRDDGEPAQARLVGHPRAQKGHVVLRVCAPEALRTEVVTRRQDCYRLARHASWGEEWAPAPR